MGNVAVKVKGVSVKPATAATAAGRGAHSSTRELNPDATR
jgi:hypothetical protein